MSEELNLFDLSDNQNKNSDTYPEEKTIAVDNRDSSSVSEETISNNDAITNRVDELSIESSNIQKDLKSIEELDAKQILVDKFVRKSDLPMHEIVNKFSSHHEWICNSLNPTTGIDLILVQFKTSLAELNKLCQNEKVVFVLCKDNQTYLTWMTNRALKRKRG